MDAYRPASLKPITSLEVIALGDFEADRVDLTMHMAASKPGVTLQGSDAQRIADLWRRLPRGVQSRCHNPPYGLRFRSGKRVLCQATLCCECDNIFGDAGGRPFHHEFDASHPTSRKLLAELRRAVWDTEPA